MRRHRPAFTLVELLVVIGIIAVLISILMPALSAARNAAMGAQCLSNQRQIATAIAMYTTESKNAYLPPYRLTSAAPHYAQPHIFSYLPNMYFRDNVRIFLCPTDSMQTSTSATLAPRGPYYRTTTPVRDVYYSYALNGSMPKSKTPVYGSTFAYNSYNPPMLSKVRNPAELAVFIETRADAQLNYNSIDYRWRFDHQKGTSMSVSFADGHAEFRRASEMVCPKGTPNTSLTNQALWPTGFRAFWFGNPTRNTPYHF